jgi:hypothetical protein
MAVVGTGIKEMIAMINQFTAALLRDGLPGIL